MNNYNEYESEERDIWNKIKKVSKSVEISMDSLERKITGSYFTSLDLTDNMMHELVEKLVADKKDISKLKFLEPCVGTGNFVFSYLKEIKKLKFDKDQMIELLNNLYFVDINEIALFEFKSLMKELVNLYFDIKLSDKYFEDHIGKGLLINVKDKLLKYIKLGDVFPNKVIKDGFDIVVTNPPYKNLKAEKGQYDNIIDYKKDKEKYADISKLVKKEFNYSTTGILNLYKIFVEEIIKNYSKKGAYISLLVPSSILSNKTCTKLRTYLLNENKIISIKIIKEGSSYINAKQALTTLFIIKNDLTSFINLTRDFCCYPNESVEVALEDILNETTGNSIFAVNKQEYNMLKKLKKFPIVGELPYIINSRGELDLTNDKGAIVNNDTGHQLLRGKNIDYYKLSNLKKEEFVSEDFIKNSKKKKFINKDRIICQQVVNMRKERRVIFSYIADGYILGNSCNFITVENNNDGIDLFAILGLFNTNIINWLFKLTSSNNHVNNYEIDSFPVPLKPKILKEISSLVQEYLLTKNDLILKKIEELAYLAYEIDNDLKLKEVNKVDRKYKNTKKENKRSFIKNYLHDIKLIIPDITYKIAENIIKGDSSIDSVMLKLNLSKFEEEVVKGITLKYKNLSQGKILNHTTFKLSDLDIEMISSIPQGGNWKNIPKETVEKSKRLKGITKTGGRTTLYGRIDYTKPSYTITTYFNRPGNGTYVHPIHNRVLSVREASRFQGFKDEYYFFGNKTQVLKQVGNAVPTILAYQIAKNIINKTTCRKSIDLFCGAGGLTVGFKEAGIISVLSNDIEKSACITLKINNPSINTFIGDVTQKETKDHIIEIANKNNVDIICGGPPCQGFSTAGLRLKDDPRNKLFMEFIEIVRKVSPKIIVFENVPGLLSFNGGEVYKDILKLFSEMGYDTEGRKLMATNYGVPQKRKRVIIICTKKDLNIKPLDLFPNVITEEPEKQITAKETIEDLENIECKEDAFYIDGKESEIIRFFRGKLSYDDFIKNRCLIYKK